VIDPVDPPGLTRRATNADLDLGIAWTRAFVAETGVVAGVDPRRNVEASISQGRLWFWQDGDDVVSLTGTSPSVARVSRIGPVFTPPEHRGRGYARSLVAEVSRQRLADGNTSCCLFTDLANPVSNQIYQQVGYRPVDDFAEITFESR
jgi:predicted GNAT family acetyltransferase